MHNAFNNPKIQFTYGYEWNAFAKNIPDLIQAVNHVFDDLSAASAAVDAREVIRGFSGRGASYTYDRIHFTVKYFDSEGKHLLTKCFKCDANSLSLVK